MFVLLGQTGNDGGGTNLPGPADYSARVTRRPEAFIGPFYLPDLTQNPSLHDYGDDTGGRGLAVSQDLAPTQRHHRYWLSYPILSAIPGAVFIGFSLGA